MSQFRIRRTASALLLAAASVTATVALAGPAHAGTDPIKVRSTAIQGGNGISISGTTVRDVIRITNSGSTIRVSSTTGPVTAFAPCVQKGAEAECKGAVSIQAFGGSGNDEINNDSSIRMGANGGSGDDILRGGSNNDSALNGGLGFDTSDGRGGRDTCSAEKVISCEEVTS